MALTMVCAGLLLTVLSVSDASKPVRYLARRAMWRPPKQRLLRVHPRQTVFGILIHP